MVKVRVLLTSSAVRSSIPLTFIFARIRLILSIPSTVRDFYSLTKYVYIRLLFKCIVLLTQYLINNTSWQLLQSTRRVFAAAVD